MQRQHKRISLALTAQKRLLLNGLEIVSWTTKYLGAEPRSSLV
jgi:hypothetical protein